MATGTTVAKNIQKEFEQAGFVVSAAQPGRLELKKSGCVAQLEKRGASWIYSGPPCLVKNGINCELEDRGFQKFWLSKADGKRFPIRKTELEILHRFDEEVRHIAGLKSLYNESLGTTNAQTDYDRLTGRPDR